MSVAPVNQPRGVPVTREAGQHQPQQQQQQRGSREELERQAWTESPSDRTQLLPRVDSPAKLAAVKPHVKRTNRVGMEGESGANTPVSKMEKGPEDDKLQENDTKSVPVAEKQTAVKVETKPTATATNGTVKTIVVEESTDNGKDLLDVVRLRKGSKSCPNLSKDEDFLPRPRLQVDDLKETLQLEDFVSESEFSQHTEKKSGFWTSIKAVNNFRSAMRKEKKRKRQKVSVQRVDSFLEKFTTRRGDIPTHLEDDDQESEIKADEVEKEKSVSTIIEPDGDFIFYWLFVVTVAIVYNFWVLIAREAWPELQEKGRVAWFVFDYLCDFVYIVDIVVHWRTAFLEQGLLVMDTKKLTAHYIKSWEFVVDVLSLLPTDLFYLLDRDRWHPMVRFPRFLRVYRAHSWYFMAESRTQFPNLFRVFNLTHVLLLLLHWAGAAYFLICEAIGFGTPLDNWIYSAPDGRNATLPHKYLASFYWSTLTLTTIGDLPAPHNEVEYVVQILGYLVGIFIFATIVGQVGAVIENRNATRMEFERHVDHAKRYMRSNNVPREVQLRVLRWYDYTWARGAMQGRGDVNSLGLLPDKHRTELALHVNLHTLKRVSILQVCPPEFLHDLVLKMHMCIFTPGDLVCRKGEVAREMFIISDGLLDVMDELGHVVVTLKSGDYFGEIGILDLEGTSNRRVADVQSVGFSELFSLSKDDVLGVLRDYPQVKSVIEEEARRRLNMQKPSPSQKDDTKDDVDPVKKEKDIDAQSIISHFSSVSQAVTSTREKKTSSIKRDSLAAPLPGSRRPSVDNSATNVRRSKRKSTASGSVACPLGDQALVKEIMTSVEKLLREKIDSMTEETRQAKESARELRDRVANLQQENDSKLSTIQVLELRIKELEKSLAKCDTVDEVV
ncbi:cyclic nucleotide-gated channel alpha-3-like [Diadema antillarum]|uniref:cyclic nucleotide-gated channel alpha-3-like n=1 Tax=Diadema antillarum TaxID=105358 RepID=UPI003A876934